MIDTDHADSWYVATTPDLPISNPLSENDSAEVCVIGGGFTGLSAALHLARRGVDVIVLEANRAGWGASGRNGGQLGSGQRVEQDELIEMFGADVADRLWQSAENAKRCVFDLISDYGIECNYTPGLLYTCLRTREVAHYRAYADLLQTRYDYDAIRFVDEEEVQELVACPHYKAGILDSGAGHLHPLRLASGLASAAMSTGVRLHEKTRVIRYRKNDGAYDVETAHGTVRCRNVVLATNGYLGKLEPKIASRIMPINNYIIATEPLGAERAASLVRDNVAVADSKAVVDYYRLTHDHRLLFGGGESYGRRFPNDIVSKVRPIMLRVFDQLSDVRIDYAWGGTLAITLNRLPDWGCLDGSVYYVQGYSGHGVALSIYAGQVIAEAIDGDVERLQFYSDLPSPAFPGGTLLRWPGQVAGMLYYSLMDRVGR